MDKIQVLHNNAAQCPWLHCWNVLTHLHHSTTFQNCRGLPTKITTMIDWYFISVMKQQWRQVRSVLVLIYFTQQNQKTIQFVKLSSFFVLSANENRQHIYKFSLIIWNKFNWWKQILFFFCTNNNFQSMFQFDVSRIKMHIFILLLIFGVIISENHPQIEMNQKTDHLTPNMPSGSGEIWQ